MSTLIEYRSDGKLIGRCNERCYNAVEDKCNCICDGKNHGKGYHAAVERTYADEPNMERTIEQFKRRNVIQANITANVIYQQELLFSPEEMKGKSGGRDLSD